MSITKPARTKTLHCPLCNEEVVSSSGCLDCHLSLDDVARHQSVRRRGGRAIAQTVRTRLVGAALYAGVVAWCAYQLPTILPFVVPAAVLGGGLHVIKGRPWLGLLLFGVIVVVVPKLLWPAMATTAFSELTELIP